MGNRCLYPWKAAPGSNAAADVQGQPNVVLVVNMAGATLFGPAGLPQATTVQQLKGKLPKQGHDLCQLTLGSEVLADEFVLPGGDMENPLVITSVTVPNLLRLLSPQCRRALQKQGYLVPATPVFRGFTECIYIASRFTYSDGPGGLILCNIVYNSDLLLLADGRFLARKTVCNEGRDSHQLSEGTFEVLPDGGHKIRLQMLRAATHRNQDGKWLPVGETGRAESMLPWGFESGPPDQVREVDLLSIPKMHTADSPQLPDFRHSDLAALRLDPKNMPFWHA